MPNYSGVWALPAQLQAYAQQLWPQGPGAPTSVVATAGDTQATITFVAPTFTGVPPGITGYRAISDPGGFTATGASSPLTVTGLTNSTAYTFAVDATNSVGYGPAGVSGSVTPQGPRGLFAGGQTSVKTNEIQYVTISTTGNATDFGDLTSGRYGVVGCSSSTRGVFGGGNNTSGNVVCVIDYVTISTTGNASNFGNLSGRRQDMGACSSSTRGVFAGGGNATTAQFNIIEYITIASAGNATDFGDLIETKTTLAGCSSTTRGLFGGGRNSDTATNYNSIDYITIASVGNSTDFGDLTVKRYNLGSCSSSTRGTFGGGTGGANVIDYVTIASAGNATDFGDLTFNTTEGIAGCSSSTRGLYAGGSTNIICYITIASTGNATDFGDLLADNYSLAACSDSHGGL